MTPLSCWFVAWALKKSSNLITCFKPVDQKPGLKINIVQTTLALQFWVVTPPSKNATLKMKQETKLTATKALEKMSQLWFPDQIYKLSGLLLLFSVPVCIWNGYARAEQDSPQLLNYKSENHFTSQLALLLQLILKHTKFKEAEVSIGFLVWYKTLQSVNKQQWLLEICRIHIYMYFISFLKQ